MSTKIGTANEARLTLPTVVIAIMGLAPSQRIAARTANGMDPLIEMRRSRRSNKSQSEAWIFNPAQYAALERKSVGSIGEVRDEQASLLGRAEVEDGLSS